MDNKKENNFPEQERNPTEIPSNDPQRETQPLRSKSETTQAIKHRQRMRGIKIAYGIAIVFALAGALTTKIASEKAVDGLKSTFPAEEINFTLTTQKDVIYDYETEEPDFEVRQNLTDVPDTRFEETSSTTQPAQEEEKTTIKETETSPYAQPYKDYFTLPLGTDISMDYSPDTPVYNATMGDWRTHSGVDFKGAEGSQVLAVAYGKVVKIYDDPLYGTVVEIDHGNQVIAKYCGMNKEVLEVKKGDIVKGGTLIGYLGNIPCEKTDMSHLHFEMLYKGKNVDPLELMGK